ncbi:hypothetical protein [Streptomyces sp. NPDC002738]
MSDDEKIPAREIIADYAQTHFRYFRTAEGTVYAQKNGHPVARPIRSQGTTGSHRQELMVGLFHDGRGVFNGTALKEALDLIEALALSEDVQPVHIRVAPGFDGATWLDLGRDDGQSVRIHPTGWDIAIPDPREVCWRRTQLTGELPLPAQDTDGKGIDLLLRLCNFAGAETECLAIAWLIGCLGPSVPVPAPFLTGPQGAGKSTGGRMLVRIIEGMSGDLRRAPKDEENLIAAVAAGWVTAVKVRAAEAETPTDLRMADFAHLCAQLDAATGLGALPAYRASLDDLNDDVIEGDLLAQTALRHAETIAPGAAQRMTSTEWLHCLSRLYSGDEPRPLPKGWPTTGKVLSDRLKRLQPTLAARGVLIDTGRTSAGRYLEMTRPATPPPHEQKRML